MRLDADARDGGPGVARILPALAILVAGLVHNELPKGAFGAHDVAVRAGITGATAGLLVVVVLLVVRWWRPLSSTR
jgi:hypothetical protein